MVLPSTSPKYCTQGKKPEQLTPSSQENNGKRFDLPKHTSVILDKPPAYQQTCSLNSVSLPTNHRHREPFAHGVFVFLLKSSVTSSLLWKPKLLSFPCCPRWRVAPIPLLGAGGEAARGNCCPTLCMVCSPVKISLENPDTKDQPGQLSNIWKRSKSGVSQPQEHCAWQGAFYSLASQNHRKGEQSAGSNPPVGVAHASQVELDGSGIPGSYQFREQICFPFG